MLRAVLMIFLLRIVYLRLQTFPEMDVAAVVITVRPVDSAEQEATQ